MNFCLRFLIKIVCGKFYVFWFYFIENCILLYESFNGELQIVEDRELIFYCVCVRIIGVGVILFVWGKVGDYKYYKVYIQVYSDDVDLYLCIQGRQKGEEFWWFWFGFLEQDGNIDVLEGFGEIYYLFLFICDCYFCYG